MSTNSAPQILSAIECPVCFDIMCAPIYQCNTGHSICSNCKDSLRQCPTCQDDIGLVRNYALESMVVSLLNQPCPFAEYGCQTKLRPKEIEQHQKICDYRIYVCPFCSTNPIWQGPIEELREHLVRNHEDFQLPKAEEYAQNMFKVPNCHKAKFKFFIVKDSLFYFYQIETVGGTMNQYSVEYVGSRGNRENFAYKIEICSGESRYRKIEYTELCSNYLLPLKVPRNLLDSYKEPVISLEIIEVKQERNNRGETTSGWPKKRVKAQFNKLKLKVKTASCTSY
ncbi:hypothetical protein Trydic_g6366 [Trypoxylus dichotomus]